MINWYLFWGMASIVYLITVLIFATIDHYVSKDDPVPHEEQKKKEKQKAKRP